MAPRSKVEMREGGVRHDEVTRRYSITTTVLLVLPAFLCCVAAHGQTTAQNVESDPVALVRRASKNELAPGSGRPVRYKLHKIDDGKITMKEIVETKDGDVARLIAVGDK